MKKLVVGVLSALVVVLVAWLALRDRGADAALPAAAEKVVAASAPQVTQPAESPEVTTERAALSAPAAEAAATAKDDGSSAAQPALAELRGRMLDSGGAPLAGVALELSGWVANQDREQKYGKPKDWTDLKTQSDADGRFRFEFGPPQAFQFTLEATAPGFACVSWRWSGLPPAEVTDVGDVRMPRAGSIRGRVVDERGEPVVGPWGVYASSAWKPEGAGADTTRVNARTDATRAEFLLEGLPPGPAELQAQSDMTNWIDGPVVEVRPGEELVADIVYRGPDNSRRITVSTSNRAFHVFSNPAPGTLKLLGSDGSTRVAERIARSSQSWSFEDLPPGVYTAQIDDPRFLPWSQAGLSPGQAAKARLVGASAIALSVVDESGAPVEPYRMRLRFRNVNFQPDTFELRRAGADAPANGVYTAIVPSDCTVMVETATLGSADVDVDALTAGETRAVQVRLSRGSTVSGTVLGDSAAVANALVELVRFVPEPDEVGGAGSQDYFQARHAARNDAREARADGAGRFEFEGVAAGRYLLHATVNSELTAKLGPIECPGASEGLELQLPPSGTVRGRLIGPEGASFNKLRLVFVPHVSDSDPWELHRRAAGGQPLDLNEATGEYRYGPVAAGTYAVSLSTHESQVPSGFNGTMTFDAPQTPLGEIELTRGVVERDFDVRAAFPGWLELEVSLDGRPGVGLVVEATAELAAGQHGSSQIGMALDDRGFARCGPTFPGLWRVRVRPIDVGWSWSAPTPVSVTPGAVVRLRYDIQLVRGVLRVVDATTGEALPAHGVFLSTADGSLVRMKTNSSGELELALPDGSYGLLEAPADGDWPFDEQGTPFVWSAAQGAPRELRLPRGPKGG